MSNPISSCRLCGNDRFKPVLDLGTQVLSGVFPAPDAKDPSSSPLELIRCDAASRPDACGLVQLRHSAALGEMYGATYGYHSSLSPTMISHLEGIVQKVLSRANPRPGDAVLDIGCNDGTLLNLYQRRGLERYGMDPSSRKFAANFQPDIRVVYDFFSAERLRREFGDKRMRIITSIAMFYDLDNPLAFMKDIRSLLLPDGVWALELSYLPLLLTNLTYDQVCHEHLTYLGLRQMKWLMDRAGLTLLDVSFNDVNGGSFFILAGRDDGPHVPETGKIERILADEAVLESDGPYEHLRERITRHREDILGFLRKARAEGKTVLGYGASTKGNIVLNHCGVTKDLLPAICDTNTEKHGLVTPGTRIPIISKEEARRRKPDFFLVLIWHFRKEVLQDERDYIMAGGTMAFDLPRLHVVDKASYDRHLSAPFSELAYPI
ncbi:MAG: class I SAM-dependent methyltransferase [Elusimicrobiota bacterium]|jgi:NDP-4-keto-2,6-dideoxyhexose 3-C-methyltransferase